MGSVAMGADPPHLSSTLVRSSISAGPRTSLYALYTANVLWTLLYEIIYSHRDAAYDVRAGVKNIVILYRGQTKSLAKLAVGQVLLLAGAGWLGEGSLCYWIFAVFGAVSTLAAIIARVKLNEPDNYAGWFKFGCCGFTGGAMAAGILGEYVTGTSKTTCQ